jgi:hypothetical protein
MLRITDKKFQYTPSFETDLKKKFAKLLREQRAAAKEKERPQSVVPIMARWGVPK